MRDCPQFLDVGDLACLARGSRCWVVGHARKISFEGTLSKDSFRKSSFQHSCNWSKGVTNRPADIPHTAPDLGQLDELLACALHRFVARGKVQVAGSTKLAVSQDAGLAPRFSRQVERV